MWKAMLIYYCFFVFCAVNITSIYFNLNNKKLKFTKKFIVTLALLSIIAAIINNYNLIYIKSLFSLIALFVILIFCFNQNIKKSFIYSILIWVFGLLLDLLFMTISSFLLGFMSDAWINKFSLHLMYSLTVGLQILYNVLSRIKLIKKMIANLIDIISKIKIKYIYNLIFLTVIIYITILSLNNLNDIKYVISMFALGLFLLIIKIKNFILSYDIYMLKEANSKLINNNKFFVEINSETRKFKHNLIHKLNGIKSYGNKKTKELINIIIQECNLLANNVQDAEKLPTGINGLICQKLYQKEYNDLIIMINNELDFDLFENLKARNYNMLCEVLGVVMDNSLTAALNSKEKVFCLNIKSDNKSVNILIQNTFNSTLDLEKLGDINYTTKSNGNGIGLFSILFKKEVKTKISIINNLFITEIVVSKIKNKH